MKAVAQTATVPVAVSPEVVEIDTIKDDGDSRARRKKEFRRMRRGSSSIMGRGGSTDLRYDLFFQDCKPSDNKLVLSRGS